VDRKEYRRFLIGGFHRQDVNDLNAAQIATDDGFEPLQDFSTISDDGKVRVFFKNLEEHLIQYSWFAYFPSGFKELNPS
jgi:hypothetical protein